MLLQIIQNFMYLYCTNVLSNPHVNIFEANTPDVNAKFANIGYLPMYGTSPGKTNVQSAAPEII